MIAVMSFKGCLGLMRKWWERGRERERQKKELFNDMYKIGDKKMEDEFDGTSQVI